ncbi:hypothetical protein [Tenacibaculum sp. C7A-26P2]|uniref:hypothetical protein n=1 Tax=Tenacibaculum sp. C7A-26P2 TaxID=3447504 RepID=UPI003F86CCC5
MKEVNVHIKEGTETLEILQGDALPRLEPEKVQIAGLINAPYEYLTKRIDVVEQKKCHVIVNHSSGALNLVVDEKNAYQDVITGELKPNPDFINFGINDGSTRDTFELADFIKMNRFFFSDKNTAMKLVSELKNFKAKVNKQIEASDNDRGNTRLLKDQVVQSNIPESFDITVPIFKGQPAQTFKVEININGNSFACALISPDAKDLINEVKSQLLNEQIDKIREIAPDIAILEV